MTRTLEMHAEIEGEEFPIVMDMNDDRVWISNGGHGEIYLSWKDFDAVVVEAWQCRRLAKEADATAPEAAE